MKSSSQCKFLNLLCFVCCIFLVKHFTFLIWHNVFACVSYLQCTSIRCTRLEFGLEGSLSLQKCFYENCFRHTNSCNTVYHFFLFWGIGHESPCPLIWHENNTFGWIKNVEPFKLWKAVKALVVLQQGWTWYGPECYLIWPCIIKSHIFFAFM